VDFTFNNLFSSLVISLAGASFFMYGKKAQRPFPLMAGIAMSVYPFFVVNVLALWIITAGVLAALFCLRQR
jgi:hypothetical protein